VNSVYFGTNTFLPGTISYALVMGISVAAGAMWDLTGNPAFAFLPVGLVVLPLVLLAPTIRFYRD
jgi:CP family cyanate transporter-like MFS transporter